MISPRTSTIILAATVLIGLIADQLLRAPTWGINVPIAAGLLAAAGLAMPSDEGRAPWPWLGSVFFAAMWAVRDISPILPVNFLAALALASLPLLTERSIQLRAVHLVDLVTAPLHSAWAITVGTLGFVQAAPVRPAEGSGARAPAVAAGLLLAAPLVFIFGGLFASADPVFDTALASVFDGTLGPLFSHSVTVTLLAWASAGYLWTLARPPRPYGTLVPIPQIGGIQVLTPLVATAVMFALFIGVQTTSLFGGAAFVETTTGLTFAEYARKGFFELVFASALVLPLVYFAPAVAGPLGDAGTRRLRGVLMIQLGLTGLVLASALWRMALYIGVYGLTKDRVHGTAVMLWIAGTLGVFAVTVVRGRPGAAAFGSLISAVVALAALNLANPQRLIASYNLSHPNGREVDFAHLSRLSGDAVPVLVEHFDRVPAAFRCELATRLRSRFGELPGDWRGWNLARTRAHEAVLRLPDVGPCPESLPAAPSED